MKQHFITLFLVVLTASILRGQTINACRYWFDDNFSARQNAPLIKNGSDALFSSNISTNGLSIGGHIFNCQCSDNDNKASSIISQFFIKMPEDFGVEKRITAYQVSLDNNSPQLVTVNGVLGEPFELNQIVNIEDLSLGGHIVNIRFKDNTGQWSPMLSQFFIKRPPSQDRKIMAYEYWFDKDEATPTARHFTPITTAEDYTFMPTNSLDLAHLAIGGHILNVRFKDDGGNWSPIVSQFFIKRPPYQDRKIMAYEYWFDADEATPTTRHFTNLATASADLTYIPVNGLDGTHLAVGGHILNVRFKDDAGNWSSIISQFFIKTPATTANNKIMAYQYWFDDNTSNIQTVNLPNPVADYSLLTNLNVSVPAGFHKLYVRFKDLYGNWSGIIEQPFSKYEPGITLIVHGFSLDGSFPDWTLEMAQTIKGRIGDGNNAVIYKNDPVTSTWVLYGDAPTDANREIILVYDWADLSNNGLNSVVGFNGNGYLESAADNLFAMLLNVPMNLGNNTDILNRPKHFIGHSRGTIVLLQMLHRLRKFFPNVSVEQVTFLDPHPASPFGDVEGNYLINNVKNLPCISGRATGSLLGGIGQCELYCGKDDNITIKMPDNVLSFDNYFRRDGFYEGAFDISGIASFDGINVAGGGNFNRELKDLQLASSFCTPIGGGAHSGVHIWYRGTIQTNAQSFSECAFNTDIPFSWYVPSTIFVNPSVADANDNRQTLGFNRSRIGGLGYPLNTSERATLNTMESALIERTDYGLRPIFNGDFYYGDGGAGWTLNGGSNSFGTIVNSVAVITNSPLRHSYFYFAPNSQGNNFNYLKLKAKVSNLNTFPTYRKVRIKFKNLANQIYNYEGEVNIQVGNTWFNIFCPIPMAFQGKVATFEIESLTQQDIITDDFEFTNESPNNLVLTNVSLPIELINIVATAKDLTNLIEWSTASEKNTQWHIIERSANGKDNWIYIGKKTAIGTSSQKQDYYLLDEQPLTISYYRLRSIDFDEKESLSKIVSVNRETKKTAIINVYPVPTDDILNVSFTSTQNENITFEIVDMLGRRLQSILVKATEGDNLATLSTANLVSGVYLIHLKLNSRTQLKYFVKK